MAPAASGFSGGGPVLECRKGHAKKSGKCVKKKQPKLHKKKHEKGGGKKKTSKRVGTSRR